MKTLTEKFEAAIDALNDAVVVMHGQIVGNWFETPVVNALNAAARRRVRAVHRIYLARRTSLVDRQQIGELRRSARLYHLAEAFSRFNEQLAAYRHVTGARRRRRKTRTTERNNYA